MSEHEEFYMPEHVDEQVDALLQARDMPARDQRLTRDLQSLLQHTDEDASSLQRVLHTLMERDTSVWQHGNIMPFAALPSQHQEQGRFIAMAETHTRSMPTRHMKPILRMLSTLAAVLVVMLLSGSMLLALNAIRQKPGGTTTTIAGATQTPAEHEGQIIYTSTPFDSVRSIAWSPDGKRVAAVTFSDGKVKCWSWDARTGQHVLNYPTRGDFDIINVVWSPDGTKLAAAGNPKFYLFDATTARLLRSFPAPSVASNGTVASPLSTVGTTQRMASLNRLSGGDGSYEIVSWSPDSKYLAAVFLGHQEVVYIWDAHTGSVVKTLTGFLIPSIAKVRWSPRGNMLAIQLRSDLGTQIWDTTTWQMVKLYPKTSEMGWSPDGKQLALVEVDASTALGTDVHIVDVQSWQTVKQFAGSPGVTIGAVHWSPDDTRIAVETLENNYLSKIRIWRAASGTLLYSFSSGRGVDRAAWSSDSKYIASVENVVEGTRILIWRV